ncbi:mRNA cap guanine-N(7) methyltransferase-like [Tubulanus polymorphus]|uniref:mRNA cap guanine-N(7) methyltransferase-like n=1 Tax=Tubulanus polymorphus TaxID=672921 RepID=UPI003DA394C8
MENQQSDNVKSDTSQKPTADDDKPSTYGKKVQEQNTVGLGDQVAKHYNELPQASIESRVKSRIFYLRNFHNWIKSVLISEYLTELKKSRRADSPPISVLDLCSGKGGDMLKWKKGNIGKLVCADIAETSVQQSEERYRDMGRRNEQERYPQKMFTAEFITADCTKQRLKDMYKNNDTTFDLVSCQFSFHYSFESLQQVDMMLKNACECLKPGGYFIGTTTNSYELVKRWRAAEENSFGNEVYRIEFSCNVKQDIPLFGSQYMFHLEGVVDCPEFLGYFPAMVKLAEKYGMKLVSRKPFSEFFSENITKGDHRSLIGRMQALEPYPPEEDVDLMSKDTSAYIEADADVNKMKTQADDPRRRIKVGTLSRAEWETTTLYTTFAFQKVSETVHQQKSHSSRKRSAAEESNEISSKIARHEDT